MRPPACPAQLAWLPALREPQRVLRWTLAEWEIVIRLARRLRLLARLASTIDAASLLGELPTPVQRHLVAELQLSHWRLASLRWALSAVADAVGGRDFPLVLLKGAAYVGQSLPLAAGRLPSDVDVLVPRENIADAQQRLERAGWQEIELDDHDRHYYHALSHEAPPMHHPAHRIELDLHHNILPPVARTHVDASLLLARLQPTGWPAWQVLHPVDQVLHSAAHLFLDSEARDRVRDLVDLDGLFRHFFALPCFWDDLSARATALGLIEPLALATHFCSNWLGTPLPVSFATQVKARGPSALRRTWLLPMWTQILTPAGLDRSAQWQQTVAAMLMLARYHSNRMPLHLLIPHLWHKLRPPGRPVDGDTGKDAA
jgi:Uncharacterised nucleotidyltransferase